MDHITYVNLDLEDEVKWELICLVSRVAIAYPDTPLGQDAQTVLQKCEGAGKSIG